MMPRPTVKIRRTARTTICEQDEATEIEEDISGGKTPHGVEEDDDEDNEEESDNDEVAT